MSEEQVFLAALELPDEASRAAYLDGACGPDAALRRQVESLLAAHFRSGEFLDVPVREQINPGSSQVNTGTRQGDASSADQTDDEADLSFLAPSDRPDSLGRLGHYEVLQVLGKGGFGIVFRAFDETLQRAVAVKVLAPQVAATSPARKRFLREARSSARVRHENVVQVYGVEEQPLPHLVMEYIPGETLQQRLDRTGPLDPVEVVQLGRQIAEGLAAAHATGLIHRDIKPANILIEQGPPDRVKINDFGLARAADDASVTQSGVVSGTPLFMAPEQVQGEVLDHRADLFSLGSVLYTMASGRPPFRAKNMHAVLKRVAEDTPRPIRDLIPEVPVWLCDLISKLHAKNPDDRFATAREVADLLAGHLERMQQPGYVPPLDDARTQVMTSPREEPLRIAPVRRPPRYRIVRWAVAAGLLLMLAGGVGVAEATGVTDVQGTVIRLFSPDGTLIVEVDDPRIRVEIDGSELVITGAGAREIRLKPGRYTVEARKDGKVVSRELVTVMQNRRKVLRVTQEAVSTTDARVEKDPDRRAAEYVLAIGGAVRINDESSDRGAADLPREPFRLTYVHFFRNRQLNDAGLANFEGCQHLTHLTLWETGEVHDEGLTHFKACKNLRELLLVGIPLSDTGLAHFQGCKGLTTLSLNSTKATDTGVAFFKDCKDLRELTLRGTQVTAEGLACFKDCRNLTFLHLSGARQVTDAAVALFKDWKELTELRVHGTQFSAAGVDELKKALPWCKIQHNGGVIEPTAPRPSDDAAAWERSVAALPAEEQVKAVSARLQVLNPGFDGNVQSAIEDKVVTELRVQGRDVVNISPVRALRGLTSLQCLYTNVSDLSPLKGLKLTYFGGLGIPASDLTPLQGLPLTRLDLFKARGVSNLKALKGLRLEYLNLTSLPLSDLSPLAGMNSLRFLVLDDMPRLDLTTLAGLQLDWLQLRGTRVGNLDVIRSMPLKRLTIDAPATDNRVFLRGLEGLEFINGQPAGQFWKDVDGKLNDPDRRAAEYVLAVGGGVRVNEGEREVRTEAGLPREPFRLTYVWWNRAKVSEAGWAHFKDCKNLTQLHCWGTAVSDTGLAQFNGCANLTAVHLTGCQINDEGLTHLAGCKKLTALDLYNNDVSDTGLAHFRGHKGLLTLRLGMTRVSDAGLAHFKDCKGLTFLGLNHAQVGDDGLAHFKGCKDLTRLELGETRVSDAGLAHFKGCKNLKLLMLFKTGVGDEGLAHLKDCKELTSVWLWDTKVGDRSLALLKECKNLEALRLENTQVGDAGLVHLEGCKNLKALDVRKTRVTAAGIDRLKKALPKCKIER